MGVLIFFAIIGAFTLIVLTGGAALLFWLWYADWLDRKPQKTLKQLKKEWQLSAVEDR